MNTISSLKHLLTVQEVAQLLHIHPLSVRRYIYEGKLQAFKIAGNVRIPQENVITLVELSSAPSSSKEITPRIKKLEQRMRFDTSDPLWRMVGRGASIKGDQSIK